MVRWSCLPPAVYCVERLNLIDVVGDARDAANPNFGLLGMARAARLGEFAELHMACKLFAAWRGAARCQREEADLRKQQARQDEDEWEQQQQVARECQRRRWLDRHRLRKESVRQRLASRRESRIRSVDAYMDTTRVCIVRQHF